MGKLLCPACAGESDEPVSDCPDGGGMTQDPEEPIVCSECGIDLPCTPIEMPEPEFEKTDLNFSARAKCYKKRVKYKK